MSEQRILELDDIVVRFGGFFALDGVSMHVQEGECVGVIGPNGAGKTTLFDVISGLRRPTRGTVTLGGQSVTRVRAHQRARMGMRRSFQNLGLISDESVATNLLAHRYLDGGYHMADVFLRPTRWLRSEQQMAREAPSALHAVGAHVAPHSRISELSFAAARMTELAGLFWSDPQMLLLDEPTTGLSLAEVAHLHGLLQHRRATGTALVVIAHDVRFVMSLCDRVYVLAEGRVIFSGRPEEAQTDPQVVHAYLGRTA